MTDINESRMSFDSIDILGNSIINKQPFSFINSACPVAVTI